MELYLVYEFIYYNYEQDIQERIEFFGLHRDKEKAIEIANKRVKIGIKEYNVVLSKEIINKENPFSETECVEMYRKDSDSVSPIYSICIKKLKIEGKDEK